MTKKCNKCELTKDLTLFYKDKAIVSDGHSTICKDCKNVTGRAWKLKNKDRWNAYMRQLRATDKPMFKEIDLQRTYGIGLVDYNNMLEEQNHVCQICKKPPNGKRPLVVDHDHKTDKIRGLLCYGCNRLIVALDDHPNIEKMEAYLIKYKKPA